MARIITITSGKGGVGKTCLSLNLSLSLASQGFKVCLLDADLGMANVNILTGIYPDKDLGNVISGQFTLDEIIIKNYQGIDIIPGSSGIEQMTELSPTRTGTLISAFLELEDYDYFIFDTSAGISPQVVSFCGGQQAAVAAGGRAYRQPGPGPLRGDNGPVQGFRPGRRRRADRHPRPEPDRPL